MNPSDILSAEERAALRNAFMAMVVAGVTLTVPAHAMDAEGTASTAAAADGLSTLAVLAQGGIEANPVMPADPVGIVAATALKMAAPRLTRDMEPRDRKTVLQAMSGFWTFAGAQNACVLLLAGLIGPGSVPVCAGVGAGAGVYAWRSTGDKVDAEQAQVVALAKE